MTKDAVDERELTQNKTGNCPVCEKGHHDIEDCINFLTQPVQNRSKRIFKMKICYVCLAAISKDHSAKKIMQCVQWKVSHHSAWCKTG